MKADGFSEKPIIESMSLGQLVKIVCLKTSNFNNRLNSLDGQGSPHQSEQELRNTIHTEYTTDIKPYADELDKRERDQYLKKDH